MKQFSSIVALLLLGSLMLSAQKPAASIVMQDDQVKITYTTKAQAGQTVLPLISAAPMKGAKETFGIVYRSSAVKSPLFDILDEKGAVLKTVTVNDFLGKSTGNGVRLVSADVTGERVSETVHSIDIKGTSVMMQTTAMVTGEQGDANAPLRMIVTISLSSPTALNAAVRMHLNTEGSFETKKNGIVISGKSRTASMAMVALPLGASIDATKNSVTVKSPAVPISGETPVLWFIVNGEPSNAAASAAIGAAATAMGEPSIVIVNTTNKPNAQPGDTVTYTLVCRNIGTGDATDVVVSNPIPNGTLYLEGSASDAGAGVTIERSPAAAPQIGTANVIRWKLSGALRTGASQNFTFKVIIQ